MRIMKWVPFKQFQKDGIHILCRRLSLRSYLILTTTLSDLHVSPRVGVANFISLLVQKVGVDINSYTSMLLKLLFPVVKEEKSGAAKRAFASACAIVLKYEATSQAEKLIEDTLALHTGDRNAQIACAILLKSYSSMASDVLSGYHASVIPVIFLSRSDSYLHFCH